MLASLALLVAATKPILFPQVPIPAEMKRGEQLYYSHKGVDRVFLEDRDAVGKWFDGTIKRDTDEVVWLSPSLVSRWLGYLNAKEKWSTAELMARWNRLSTNLDGAMTFVVQLYALPKEGFLDLTDDGPTKPETATETRFLVTWPADFTGSEEQHVEISTRNKNADLLNRREPHVLELACFKAYSMEDVNRWPWYALSPEFEPLLPEFAGRKPTSYDGVVGDYVRAIYLVQIPAPVEPIQRGKIQVRIFAPGKEPVASFDLRLSGK